MHFLDCFSHLGWDLSVSTRWNAEMHSWDWMPLKYSNLITKSECLCVLKFSCFVCWSDNYKSLHAKSLSILVATLPSRPPFPSSTQVDVEPAATQHTNEGWVPSALILFTCIGLNCYQRQHVRTLAWLINRSGKCAQCNCYSIKPLASPPTQDFQASQSQPA